jgi:NADPH:quinone reductase-like Zn-dependent oxidoreductase
MRHVLVPRYGGPEVLSLREGPPRSLRADEVRIAVRAAGVNFADVLGRMGLYPDAPKPPFVPGYEVAGVLVEAGADVRHLPERTRVVALTRFGGYATEVIAPAAHVFPLPPSVGDAEAAALPVNYLTALLALYKLANVTEGETVLIHGAGGGVGIAAVQLARLRGAVIIGAASAAKHAALERLGVERAIDYRTQDIDAMVRTLTGGRGADVILDPIGGKSFARSYRLLAPLGRLILYGVSAIAPGRRRSWWHAGRTIIEMPSFKPLSLMNRNKGVFGLNLAHLWDERQRLQAAMQFVLQELAGGRIQPIVARTFPLAEAADAHRYLQARSNVGKVVLTCGDPAA